MSRQLTAKIHRLKQERNAVILAHNYQAPEVQDVADFVGDSFGLSRQAAATPAEVIVFCGVHFMAESAYILAPHKTVLLPEKHAGCPLAETITAEDLKRKKRDCPDAAVVCYVNSSAAVKAESDICCTSSNAVQVVNSLEKNRILFVPDGNLAHWVAGKTDKAIIPWDGHCITHQRVTKEDVERIRETLPRAVIAVHPECRPEVVERADFVGSTSAILRFARETRNTELVIGTEMGIIHRMTKENPDKKFYLLSQGLVCPNMKMTTLEKVALALENMEPRITVPDDVRRQALTSLKKMLEVT